LVKIETKFILFLIYYFLKVSFETIKRLLLKEISNNEVELYLFILAEILPDSNVKGIEEYF
jgi:hypothetical protein